MLRRAILHWPHYLNREYIRAHTYHLGHRASAQQSSKDMMRVTKQEKYPEKPSPFDMQSHHIYWSRDRSSQSKYDLSVLKQMDGIRIWIVLKQLQLSSFRDSSPLLCCDHGNIDQSTRFTTFPIDSYTETSSCSHSQPSDVLSALE